MAGLAPRTWGKVSQEPPNLSPRSMRDCTPSKRTDAESFRRQSLEGPFQADGRLSDTECRGKRPQYTRADRGALRDAISRANPKLGREREPGLIRPAELSIVPLGRMVLDERNPTLAVQREARSDREGVARAHVRFSCDDVVPARVRSRPQD